MRLRPPNDERELLGGARQPIDEVRNEYGPEPPNWRLAVVANPLGAKLALIQQGSQPSALSRQQGLLNSGG